MGGTFDCCFRFYVGHKRNLDTNVRGLSEAVSSPKTDHHLTRTRYVRQVFLIAGSILKPEASDTSRCRKLFVRKWNVDLRDASRQFVQWSMILDL